MYKQGPAGQEECELSCSGMGDAITELGIAAQITLEQGSSSRWVFCPPGAGGGGPGSWLRFSSSPFILIETAWKTNQALAHNM